MSSKKTQPSVLHRYERDEKGGVAVMAALLTPIIIGLIGLAVEVGDWQSERQTIQSAADIAAYAGSVELSLVDDEDQARNVAYAAAMLNGMDTAELDISFEDAGEFRAIRVNTNRSRERFFTRLYSENDRVELSSTSAAFYEPASVGACVLILGSDGIGLIIAGTGDLDTTGCAVHSNKTGINAFNAKGSSQTITECMTVVGTVSATTNQLVLNTCEGVEENAKPMADPYADIPIPTTTQVLADGTFNNYGQGDHFGAAGVIPTGYYTNLIVQSNSSFADGATVIVDGGILDFRGNNTVTGTDVTLILINGATIKTSSQFNLQLSAKSSGPYAGMLLIGDRSPAIEDHTIVGGSSSQLTGAIYLPTGNLKLAGGSHADTGCTHFIAYSLQITGNSTLRNVCGGIGTRTIGSDNPAAVRFVRS